MYKTPQRRTTFGSCNVEKVHAVVARSTFPSQNVQNTSASDHFWKLRCRKSARGCGAKHISKSKVLKNWRSRTTFGSCDVEKVHVVVARSTFPSQNVQNTSAPDHFWKLRCRKSARRCGAKHISKSKCTKHLSFGQLLEVEMLKKCTPLWREAHFEVKSVKNWRSRTTFGGSDVEKVSKKCTPLWREAHFQVKMYKTPGVRTTFGGSDVASLRFASLHYTTLHSTTLHYMTLHYTPLHYNYNYTTTLHYTPLHSTTLNYTTLHYITLHSTSLHYTPPH